MANSLSLNDAQRMTLPQLLRWHAQHTPNKKSLRQKHLGIWRTITWGEYNDTARMVALGLHMLGLKRGDRIAIASEGTPEWFYADLGSEMIGVEVVGIYPTNPWNELQYIVGHCKARAVFCGDQEQADKVMDAMQNGDGLPHLQHVICVNMKGMKRNDQGIIVSFEHLIEMGRQKVASEFWRASLA